MVPGSPISSHARVLPPSTPQTAQSAVTELTDADDFGGADSPHDPLSAAAVESMVNARRMSMASMQVSGSP